MGINCQQLRDIVIKPALASLGMNTDDAVYLLLLTAAQETRLGYYLVQQKIGFNGGIGIYQMEANAYHSIWDNMIAPYPAMKAKMKLYTGYDSKPPIARMATDLTLATIMARLYYYRVKEALPKRNDVKAMAQYWKKYWNTELGKGTVEQAVKSYDMFVRDAEDI